MGTNRNYAIIGTVFVIVFFGILIVFNPRGTPTEPGYWLSLATGAGLGIFTCLYLQLIWDPINLQLKDPNARAADPKWMGPVVVLGVITARVLSYIFIPEIQIRLANFIFAWFAILFGYMAFQAWRYRPK